MDTVVAGAVAAFTVDLLIYPLDTLKTRLQAPHSVTRFPSGRGLYGGLYQGVGSVIVATLPAAGLFFTTYEETKNVLASSSSPFANAPSALSHMLASSTAELVSCLILTPAEIIKQRAQVVNKQQIRTQSTTSSPNSTSCPAMIAASAAKEVINDAKPSDSKVTIAKETVKHAADKVTKQAPPGSAASTARHVVIDAQEKLHQMSSKSTPRTALAPLSSTFGRSYLALAGRNLPFTALQFPIYESLRETFGKWAGLKAGTHKEDGEVDDVRSSEDFIRKAANNETTVATEFTKAGLVAGASAAIAGSFAAVVTTPIDVAKTRIMLDTSAKASTGVIATIKEIGIKEGWKALMKGGALRGAWTALGAGVYLGSYEAGRLWWRDRQQISKNA
ncbi:related to PET8 protein, member of the mitochondrial carrier (MCF) family [Melanopsichium pennsylvanicum]|uniref:Related to PET8 protein, member of the mitochondrial carrier (MCF) family n=2 Tax=Melanopsichium pennsylvanicum TaxID=63383 RepID=A0AAJ4XIZ4_9BASI|nr:related to PET8 protein, member of the mitochondrial carrier (MCF) family [Melanopsichium pennsylvanicum 4]SNX82998.1 related to PET8 protein, member of the mitochondrial carrier (MCF) family [Melanopsichium pennsylvanicum]